MNIDPVAIIASLKVVAIAIAFYLVCAYVIKRTTKHKNKAASQPDPLSSAPVSFGPESSWVAIKVKDNVQVLKYFTVRNARLASWEDGVAYTGNHQTLFLTPEIDGWILVLGLDMPPVRIKNFLVELSKEFGEAQFFTTDTETGTHGWAVARHGEIIRSYFYLGEWVKNLDVEGPPTAVEAKYNLVNTFSEEAQRDDLYVNREDLVFPDDDMVMEVAEAWSVNPSTLGGRTDLQRYGMLMNVFLGKRQKWETQEWYEKTDFTIKS